MVLARGSRARLQSSGHGVGRCYEKVASDLRDGWLVYHLFKSMQHHIVSDVVAYLVLVAPAFFLVGLRQALDYQCRAKHSRGDLQAFLNSLKRDYSTLLPGSYIPSDSVNPRKVACNARNHVL